jgi:hypothetical protein
MAGRGHHAAPCSGEKSAAARSGRQMRGDERAWCRVLVRGEARGAGARSCPPRRRERTRSTTRLFASVRPLGTGRPRRLTRRRASRRLDRARGFLQNDEDIDRSCRRVVHALRGGKRPILPTLPAKKMTGGCETPQATTNHERTSHKSDQLTTEGREAHAKKATTGTRRVRGGVRIEHLVFLC